MKKPKIVEKRPEIVKKPKIVVCNWEICPDCGAGNKTRGFLWRTAGKRPLHFVY